MSIGRNQIVLSLTQRRLAAALICAGRPLRVESIELDPARWATAWAEGLMPYDSELRRVLTRLQSGRETPITVLYNSPSAVLGSFNLPGTRAEAGAAAAVRIRESASSHGLSAAYPVAPAGSGDGCWSVLGISERDDTANALFGWVVRAGGRLAGVVPIQFAVAIEASRRAARSDRIVAECLIGRDWTAVACGGSDAFHLIRVFELGYGALAEVHAQAAADLGRKASGEADLFTIGVPFKNRDINPSHRSTLLPQLSPIIQRLCIEIKQTLRFGVSGANTPGTLHLVGVAGRIPEFVPALVEGVDMHIEADTIGADADDPTQPFAEGSVERGFLPLLRERVTMRPAPLLVQDAARSLRRAVLVGGLFVAAAMGIEYAWITRESERIEHRLESMSRAVATSASHRERQEHARRIALRAGRAATGLLDSIAFTPNTGMILTHLASAVPESVELTSIDLRRSGGDPEITVTGIAIGVSDEAAGDALNSFVTSVAAGPEIASVEVGATTRLTQGDATITRGFTLQIVIAESAPEFAPLAMFAQREDEE